MPGLEAPAPKRAAVQPDDGAADLLALAPLLASIRTAPDTAATVRLLRLATTRLGAEAAMFGSVLKDDSRVCTYRYLLACDPVWGQQYAQNEWCKDDPWLRYAHYNAEPIMGDQLPELDARQRFVVDGAAHFGFRHVLVTPAPTIAAQSRVTVLCLGSSDEAYFAGPRFEMLRLCARLLADELRDCVHRHMRDELMLRARITPDDLTLLRHQQQGHSSKVIAAALNIEPGAIDCRFQRLSLKLGVGNRRAALRMAEIYALI